MLSTKILSFEISTSKRVIANFLENIFLQNYWMKLNGNVRSNAFEMTPLNIEIKGSKSVFIERSKIT